MTTEEMIKNKAKEYAYNNYEQGGDSDTCEDIYTDGAGYGYQLAVEKACEWLENELQKWVILLTFDEQEQRTAIHNTVERLKKTMKGGEE